MQPLHENGRGCPACAGQQVIGGYNDLGTTHRHLVAEWDQARNGSLTPEDVIAGSARKAQWICSLGHRYTKPINKRAKGSACQYCFNRMVLSGFNDLATRHPGISRDWHPEKNGSLTPTGVVPGNMRRWRKCAWGHEQLGAVANRTKTGGCSVCAPDRRVQKESQAVLTSEAL
ncbi:zinc-ribbon domain-containing protein [Arthrobacter zhaoxinii]|uniref:zinc-ribbon domain-containing protein n=1 Tax=Arthrobacter zhaoxinii TaxID=2964616 RepID=UPI00387E5A06